MRGGGYYRESSGSTRDFVCHAGAGAAAGSIAATFVCPLDVIKTRLQVHGLPPGHQGSIIITSLRNITEAEGLRGLYRGLSPTIIALLPNWAVRSVSVVVFPAQWKFLKLNPFLHQLSYFLSNSESFVYFTVYERLKGMLHKNDDGSDQLSTGANMIAAAGAGIATSITINPLWVVKTRLQTQCMRPDVVPYKSVLSALSRITHEEGLRGLYSGIVPSLMGISHVVIQFPAYEKMKSYMAKRDNTSVNKLSPGRVAIASSVSKVVASIITYPHEVVRSRLQEQGQAKNLEARYGGLVDCVRKVYQSEGFPGFYRGCATNLLRTTPSAVITFTSYEMIHRFLEQVLPRDKKHSHSQPEPGGDGAKEGVKPGSLQQAYHD